MRFLLNMNMAKAIGQTLHELGHQSVHVREVGLDRADDATVVEYARKENLVIVTHDLDYGELLMLSPGPRPSVIIFRLRVASVPVMAKRLQEAWAEISQATLEGAVIIIEEASVRVRSLGN